MREVIRLALLKLLSNLAASVSGPWGWLVKLLIKPASKIILGFYDSTVEAVKNYLAKKKDEQNAKEYDETLKDGSDEQKQDQASTDLLNGN